LAWQVATSADLLVDAVDRVQQTAHAVLDGVSPDALNDRLDGRTNSIAWLLWHLTRLQDDHFADAFAGEQIWLADGWYDRFALPFPPSAHGYGQSAQQVSQLRVESPDLLRDYHDAVHDRSVSYLRRMSDADLDRIVDASWDPPVTLAVRLVSVISDDLQHAGQAAFLRGILQRRA
jgi:uncharacterized damage-inducible protein DinB